jgi:hypothetical protein
MMDTVKIRIEAHPDTGYLIENPSHAKPFARNIDPKHVALVRNQLHHLASQILTIAEALEPVRTKIQAEREVGETKVEVQP